MKKIEIDPIPDKLLKIKNGYKIAAITYIVHCIMGNIADCTSHLSIKEREKVNKEVDKIVDGLMVKRRKLHGLQ
jgi:hypothetical protein